MERLYPGIYHSEDDHPFDNEVCTRAYVVSLPEGNLLFYSSSNIEQNFAFIQDLGGLAGQYLNHRDEASAYCDRVRDRFGSPLHCHQLEEYEVSQHCQVATTFKNRQQLRSNLEAIPTPGHCPGSSCYLLTMDEKHYLFCGDTIYPDAGQWKTYLSGKRSSKPDMIQSLELLRSLPVDVVLPGLYIGTTSFEAVSSERWNSIIDQCLCQLG
ncbi:MAG: MBL fold metallo-hydrolase [Motiliproteus sp.]